MNGVDVSTGSRIELPGDAAEITAAARAFNLQSVLTVDRDSLDEYIQTKQAHLGVASGVKPKELSTTGWGVVFTAGEDPDVMEALRPLLEWRKSQAGPFYREYKEDTGYSEGQTKQEFLHDADGFGPVDPEANGVPYYLMLVGGPDKIPYTFQYLLDVQYGVGRIHFDTPQEYRLYAENVVAAEKGKLTLPKKAAFYGTANKNDTSTTEGSNKKLIEPLQAFAGSRTTKEEAEPTKWEIVPEPAVVTRAAILELLDGAPALVMMAAHGAKLPLALEEEQKRFNGALLSEDFEFPDGDEIKPIPLDAFLTANDIPSTARMHGSIFVLFACYGGGTPEFEDFVTAGEKRKRVAKNAFLAALPKKLLTTGALAVVAHVERAWTTSFEGQSAETNQLQTFTTMWDHLMQGYPIGFAMESFNTKYAELATMVADAIFSDRQRRNLKPDAPQLRSLWEAMHDARNFCVIGDPAVRVSVSGTPSGRFPIGREPVTLTGKAKARPTVKKAPQAEKPEKVVASLDVAPVVLEDGPVTLEQMVTRMGATLQSLVDGLTALEVTTYVSGNVATVTFSDEEVAGATMKARTRLGVDGKIVNVVPEKDGKVDDALLAFHMASVDKAVANRAELIQLATAAAANLLSATKK